MYYRGQLRPHLLTVVAVAIVALASIVPTHAQNAPPASGGCLVQLPVHLIATFQGEADVRLVNGTYVENFIFVEYACDEGWHLRSASDEPNYCGDNAWRDSIPECERRCAAADVLSTSTKAVCEIGGVSLPCDGREHQRPGTVARISCQTGYREPDDRSGVRIVCNADGSWSAAAMRCEQSCGSDQTNTGVVYIHGGGVVNNTRVPWHVGIYDDVTSTGGFSHICGGTILTNRIVISAAHCFWSTDRFNEASRYRVVTGKYFRAWDHPEPLLTQRIPVLEIRHWPTYRDEDGLYEADIALLVLRDVINFHSYVAPICLRLPADAESVPLEGQWGMVAGWGVEESGRQSGELKMLQLPVVSKAECLARVDESFVKYVLSDKFCGGFVDREESLCRGDSGGGMVIGRRSMDGEKVVHYLYGLVSTGKNCQKYAAFTRVHQYERWVQQSINELNALHQCRVRLTYNLRAFYLLQTTEQLPDDSLVASNNTIVYRCETGWNLRQGDAVSNTCLGSVWTDVVPECERHCDAAGLRAEGTRATCVYQSGAIPCDYGGLRVDTIAQITCRPGYRRSRNSGAGDRLTCGRDGFWSASPTPCEPICGVDGSPGTGTPYVARFDGVVNNTLVPWHVGVYSDLARRGRFEQVCAGTILTSRLVLSAVSCFWNADAKRLHSVNNRFMVATGKNFRAADADEPLPVQWIAISNVRHMPHYADAAGFYSANVALLVLRDVIEFRRHVVPICVDLFSPAIVEVGRPARVAGWTRSAQAAESRAELRVVDVPTVTFEECREALQPNYTRFLTTEKFCAGLPTEGHSLCHGDTGAGLVTWNTKQGGKFTFQLLGLVTTVQPDFACASERLTAVTNVHDYDDWIAVTMKEPVSPSPRPVCGVDKSQTDTVPSGHVPWHVAVYRNVSGRMVQQCGGTIITRRLVLSAAHCFWNEWEGRFNEPSSYRIAMGKKYRDWDAAEPLAVQRVPLLQIRRLPGYADFAGMYNEDIALLELRDSITFHSHVVPICVDLSVKGSKVFARGGEAARVPGWRTDGAATEQLRLVDLPIVTTEECRNVARPMMAPFVTTKKFCAGQPDGGSKAVCKTDAGGGLVTWREAANGQRTHYLKGVISVSNRAFRCDGEAYTLLSNVHFYTDWITETMSQVID